MVAKREIVSHPGGVSVVHPHREKRAAVRQAVPLPLSGGIAGAARRQAGARRGPLRGHEAGAAGGDRHHRQKHYISLGNLYPTPGYCGEIIRLWACRVDKETGELSLDPDEFLQTLRIPLDKAVEMVLHNEIPDSKNPGGHLKDRRPGGKGAAVTPAPPRERRTLYEKTHVGFGPVRPRCWWAPAPAPSRRRTAPPKFPHLLSALWKASPLPPRSLPPAPTATPAPHAGAGIQRRPGRRALRRSSPPTPLTSGWKRT